MAITNLSPYTTVSYNYSDIFATLDQLNLGNNMVSVNMYDDKELNISPCSIASVNTDLYEFLDNTVVFDYDPITLVKYTYQYNYMITDGSSVYMTIRDPAWDATKNCWQGQNFGGANDYTGYRYLPYIFYRDGNTVFYRRPMMKNQASSAFYYDEYPGLLQYTAGTYILDSYIIATIPNKSVGSIYDVYYKALLYNDTASIDYYSLYSSDTYLNITQAYDGDSPGYASIYTNPSSNFDFPLMIKATIPATASGTIKISPKISISGANNAGIKNQEIYAIRIA